MRKLFLFVLLLVTIISCKENKNTSSVKDTTHEANIEALLQKMSLEEKIGKPI